jgi:hypothetical protein
VNYKELRAHLGHVPVFLNTEESIKIVCSCGEVIAEVPKYRGAEVLCADEAGNLMNVYISFGDYHEEKDCDADSFGIPDSYIYEYLTYDEFMDIVDGNGALELDEYYRIINYELVENDRG